MRAKYEALGLKDRTWTCASCEAKHDRDVNGVGNLRQEGLRVLEHEQCKDPEAPEPCTPLAEGGDVVPSGHA